MYMRSFISKRNKEFGSLIREEFRYASHIFYVNQFHAHSDEGLDCELDDWAVTTQIEDLLH